MDLATRIPIVLIHEFTRVFHISHTPPSFRFMKSGFLQGTPNTELYEENERAKLLYVVGA